MDNLVAVYEAITPENLKSIPVYDDSMHIFIELLEEFSKVSISTENFFNHNIRTETEEELVKIYLYDYYSMIQKILNNYNIISRFRRENEILRPQLYNSDADKIHFSDLAVLNFFEIGGSIVSENYSSPEFDNTLGKEIDVNPIYKKVYKLRDELLKVSPENFYFNRIFKETKGFYSSMIYIYDIINKYLTPEYEQIPLELRELFDDRYVIGSSGIYINSLTPTNDVLKVSPESYKNPFKLKIRGSINKTLYKNTVQYLSHPLGFVYDYSQIKLLALEDYFSLTYSYKDSVVEVRCILGNYERYDKPLLNVIKYNGTIKVIFTDLSYLFQNGNIIKYFDENGRLVKTYQQSDQCVIYYTYNMSYTSNIIDTIKFKETKTLDAELVTIFDQINHVIKYSPKLGLVIGLFYFNNIDKFEKDSNVYRHLVKDETKLISFRNLRVKEIVTLLDENQFNLKTTLDIDNIQFLDDGESYKITLNNSEEIIINDEKKIKITSSNVNDEVSFENTTDHFMVRVPISVEDKETIVDSTMITNTNEVGELFKYNDSLKEVLSFKFSDSHKVYDYATFERTTKDIEHVIYDEMIKSKMQMTLNETYDISKMSDSLTPAIHTLNSETVTTTDNFVIDIVNLISDQVMMNDSLLISITTTFKNSKGLGEYLIGDTEAQISDSDNYKYYDNIDIS